MRIPYRCGVVITTLIISEVCSMYVAEFSAIHSSSEGMSVDEVLDCFRKSA